MIFLGIIEFQIREVELSTLNMMSLEDLKKSVEMHSVVQPQNMFEKSTKREENNNGFK